MTNVDKKTRRAALVSKVIEVSEQLNIKLKSRKPLGHNDTVGFLISDASDDCEVSDEKRPGVSTSTPTRVRDTDLESTNVSENVRRVASGTPHVHYYPLVALRIFQVPLRRCTWIRQRNQTDSPRPPICQTEQATVALF
ncbi:hypothetical protein FQA39_LY00894 [Lamprigera yunnana]|nr:hypothetical protein FQA39_LY00894 [Lamprigera yunnana]